MAHEPVRTVRHRRLTQLFKQLREGSGLTREQVAEHMEWYSSKLAKIETGRWSRLQPRDVRALVELYGVVDKTEQDAYVQLARDARKRGWWAQYSDLTGSSYVGFEDEATTIQTFEPLYVPGLLQTEGYARALIQSDPSADPDELDRRVTLRMERKKLLERREAPKFWAVIDEAAIRRPVDHEIMRDQLMHLTRVTSPYVTLLVVPFSAGPHPGMAGSFALLDFPDAADRPLVYLETATSGLYLEEPEEISRYRLMFNHLRAMALGPSESMRLLRESAGMQ